MLHKNSKILKNLKMKLSSVTCIYFQEIEIFMYITTVINKECILVPPVF